MRSMVTPPWKQEWTKRVKVTRGPFEVSKNSRFSFHKLFLLYRGNLRYWRQLYYLTVIERG